MPTSRRYRAAETVVPPPFTSADTGLPTSDPPSCSCEESNGDRILSLVITIRIFVGVAFGLLGVSTLAALNGWGLLPPSLLKDVLVKAYDVLDKLTFRCDSISDWKSLLYSLLGYPGCLGYAAFLCLWACGLLVLMAVVEYGISPKLSEVVSKILFYLPHAPIPFANAVSLPDRLRSKYKVILWILSLLPWAMAEEYVKETQSALAGHDATTRSGKEYFVPIGCLLVCLAWVPQGMRRLPRRAK